MVPRSHKSVASATQNRLARPDVQRRSTRRSVRALNGDAADGKSISSDSVEENDDEDASGDEVEDADTDEPEDYAPSDLTRRKRSHQTGLSLELSKADIKDLKKKKRAFSSGSDDGFDVRSIKKPRKDEDEATWQDTLTGDEGYDAVDEISESELEDNTVEAGETNIIQHEIGFSLGDDDWLQDSAFEEQYARTDVNGVRELFSHESTTDGNVSAPPGETPTRRVRFAGIDSSSSSSSSASEYDETFPDLLSQEMEYTHQEIKFPDEDDEDNPSSDGYWDLDPNNPFAEEDRVLARHGFFNKEASESSGYETDSDDGTTTEEEPEPLHSVSLPKKMLELRSTSPQPDGVKSRRLGMSRSRNTSKAKGKGPVMGTWIADPSKPIAVIGKGMIKFYHVPSQTFGPQESQASSANSSPQRSFVPLARPVSSSNTSQVGYAFDSDVSQQLAFQQSDLLSSDAFLPMELEEAAFYEEFEDDDDVSDTLDIDDIIDFGDNSSDNENEKASDPQTPQISAKLMPAPKLPKITPKQSADRPSSHSLLEHFDRGVVSAFRRNQNRAQYHLGRWQPSSLLAIKGGRHTMANNPISPIRKTKANRSLSQTSPVDGVMTKHRYLKPVTRLRQNTF